MTRSCASECALMVLALCCALLLPAVATAQVAGTNVNMVSGQKWPTGDPFLQRQNEPSMAVSTRNPLHILAGANDYRSVDLELVLSGGAETGDSWLGIFKSFDGGLTWQSTLLPGCPQLVPQCVDSGALKGGNYQAGADPVVRAGTNGMFYYAGLAFDRPTSPNTASSTSAIFVARYNDLNNNENLDPITYIDTNIVARGDSSQFLDKPALAVDIPRAGAATCSFTANEPGAGPNGGTLAVRQSFPTGNIYLAYTDFLAGTKANTTPTHLMFTHSTDCGATWSAPVQINTGTTTSQGSAISVNPLNGNVYVAWRQFASTGVNNAIMMAQSTNAGKTFSKPVQISTFQPFDQGTTGTSFRTNAYPSITTDNFGFVYVAFSARGLTASGDARVVAAGSIDGTHWTPAIMVDNPSQNAQTNPSGRGHQIMPAITFANGRLTLLYYDLRLDHYANAYTPSANSPTGYTSALQPEGELAPPNTNASKVFNTFIDDNGLTLRRHTLDLRVLQLGIFPTVVLGPSVLVSQYEYGCCLNPNMPDIEQYKFNVPNLPIFAQGQEPFLGDYIDVVPSPMFVPSGNSWVYNFTPSVNPLFHAVWTDNRDVVPPADGNWQHYTPPVPLNTPSVFDSGNTVASCVAGQEGMRNQNIYTAQITGGLVVGAPGNAKQLGTTRFNNQTVPFQRAFPVVAQNVTGQPLNVRFSIANQPTGGSASFLQFSPLTTLDVTIPAQSSVSRSVFVISSNPSASVTVNVTQIGAIGGSTVTNGLSSSTMLNPDITNPAITNPAITNPAITNPAITNFEVTNPAITNPAITNPAITNPAITNPAITNPAITNASATNPAITNPAITNPDITNPAITNPAITNPAITNGAIQDVTYAITNQGNTEASYTVKTATNSVVPGGVVLQLILSKLYQTPGASNCVLGAETHLVTVANINNPKLYNVNDPQLGNPNPTNPNPNEATVTLAPGETAYITLRVVNPTPATTPFNPATALTPVSIPQAVNTQTVLANPPGNPPPPPPLVYPQLTISSSATLPATDQGLPGYSFQLQAMGGKPGANTWSIIGGALPNGMNLSSAGLITGSAAAPGPNAVTIQVADGAGNTTSKGFSLTVNAPPSITTTSLPFALPGSNYSQTITAVGGTGTLTFTPLTVDGVNLSSSGSFTGIPVTAGSFPFTATVTDALNVSASQQFTLVVTTPLSLLAATLSGGDVGILYPQQTLVASGGTPPYSNWTWTPAPGSATPPGLSLGAGTITGTPAAAGTYSFTVSVTDFLGAMASQNYSVTVNLPPMITGATLPLAAVNQAYPPYAIPVSNGTPAFNWAQTGTLPAGLSFTNGVISGTATGGSFAAPYDVPGNWAAIASNGGTTSLTPDCLSTVTVTDAVGGSSTASFLAGSTPSSSCAAFAYAIDLNSMPGTGCCSGGVSPRTWTFQNTAATSGRLTFNWQYVGFHAFFEVTAMLQAFSGANTVTLYQAGPAICCTSPSAGFNVSGTGSIAVTAGTPVGFTVGGGNFDSNSVLNGTLYITNFTLDPAPQPPTSLTADPGAPGNAALNWTASTSPDVAGYKLYRGTSSGNYTTTISVGPATFYLDSGLATGTYYYVVTAVSNAGVESIVSNEAVAPVQ